MGKLFTVLNWKRTCLWEGKKKKTPPHTYAISSLEAAPVKDWFQLWARLAEGHGYFTVSFQHEDIVKKKKKKSVRMWCSVMQVENSLIACQRSEKKSWNGKCLGQDWEPQRGKKRFSFFKIISIFPGRTATETISGDVPVQLEQLPGLLLSKEPSELEFLA